MEYSAFVLNDDLHIPPPSLFVSVQNWLRCLQSSYSLIEASNAADANVLDFVADIRHKLLSSFRCLTKTKYAVGQYLILSDRISHIESRLSSIKTKERYDLYYSFWNQLQVYQGVRAVFKKCLIKLSVQMVDSFIVVDNLHEEFLDSFIDHDE